MNAVRWSDVFTAETMKPTRRQIRLANKFLRQWKISTEWVTSIDAYDRDSRSQLELHERDGMAIYCEHPNVPTTVNSFHLDNAAGDRQYAYWKWDNSGSD